MIFTKEMELTTFSKKINQFYSYQFIVMIVEPIILLERGETIPIVAKVQLKAQISTFLLIL